MPPRVTVQHCWIPFGPCLPLPDRLAVLPSRPHPQTKHTRRRRSVGPAPPIDPGALPSVRRLRLLVNFGLPELKTSFPLIDLGWGSTARTGHNGLNQRRGREGLNGTSRRVRYSRRLDRLLVAHRGVEYLLVFFAPGSTLIQKDASNREVDRGPKERDDSSICLPCSSKARFPSSRGLRTGRVWALDGVGLREKSTDLPAWPAAHVEVSAARGSHRTWLADQLSICGCSGSRGTRPCGRSDWRPAQIDPPVTSRRNRSRVASRRPSGFYGKFQTFPSGSERDKLESVSAGRARFGVHDLALLRDSYS